MTKLAQFLSRLFLKLHLNAIYRDLRFVLMFTDQIKSHRSGKNNEKFANTLVLNKTITKKKS